MSDYDVVIIGAGMVGSAAACRLASDGLRVALIEARLPDLNLDDNYIDLRVSAVSRGSQVLLRQLGAWRLIEPRFRSPFRVMRVWDAQVAPRAAEVLEFDSAEIGEPDIGHIVENRRIVAALHGVIADSDAVELIAPAVATDIDLGDDHVTVTLDNGLQLRARLLIGADGARSPTREQTGIETEGWSYHQKGVVTHVRTSRPHNETAWQRFLPTGPIALLPLYDGRSSIVWSTTEDEAQRLLELDEATFNREITKATDGALGDVIDSDKRAAFPLQLLHAKQYTRPRLALVGDAAHAIHPLAGQGVNLGFADVRHLAEALTAGDPGDHVGLRRYERKAKSENLVMMATLDALHRLFTSEQPVLSRLRSAGLGLVNRVTPVKQLLIRRALGH
ncbi:MAG: UbiH/UbiF/VisC/COQ6 family ubiquinone biosynthesis hydroxylase [Gammaproteobacteria bacterium]|nr:UbiH/UbiF/VisC/COQ6 family ubiquinone biosynthesis hydroxylase [Gammaproteobacteria bacterium]